MSLHLNNSHVKQRDNVNNSNNSTNNSTNNYFIQINPTPLLPQFQAIPPMPPITYTSNNIPLTYPIQSQPFPIQSTQTTCNSDNGLSAEMNQLIEYVLNNDNHNTLSNIPFNISKSNTNPRKRQLDNYCANSAHKKQRTSEPQSDHTVPHPFIKSNNISNVMNKNIIVSDVPKISGTLRPQIPVKVPLNQKQQCIQKQKKKKTFSKKAKQLKYFNEIGTTEINGETRYYWTEKGPSKTWRLPSRCHQVIKYQYESKKGKENKRKLDEYYRKVGDTIICAVESCILNERPFTGENRMTKWKSHFNCVHSKEI